MFAREYGLKFCYWLESMFWRHKAWFLITILKIASVTFPKGTFKTLLREGFDRDNYILKRGFEIKFAYVWPAYLFPSRINIFSAFLEIFLGRKKCHLCFFRINIKANVVKRIIMIRRQRLVLSIGPHWVGSPLKTEAESSIRNVVF
jgi:hypothetical protein